MLVHKPRLNRGDLPAAAWVQGRTLGMYQLLRTQAHGSLGMRRAGRALNLQDSLPALPHCPGAAAVGRSSLSPEEGFPVLVLTCLSCTIDFQLTSTFHFTLQSL